MCLCFFMSLWNILNWPPKCQTWPPGQSQQIIYLMPKPRKSASILSGPNVIGSPMTDSNSQFCSSKSYTWKFSIICVNILFREAFKIFDRDRDGFIDMKELKKVSSFPSSILVFKVSMLLGSEVDPAEIDEMMEEADLVSPLYYPLLFQIYRMETENWTTVNLSPCFWVPEGKPQAPDFITFHSLPHFITVCQCVCMSLSQYVISLVCPCFVPFLEIIFQNPEINSWCLFGLNRFILTKQPKAILWRVY